MGTQQEVHTCGCKWNYVEWYSMAEKTSSINRNSNKNIKNNGKYSEQNLVCVENSQVLGVAVKAFSFLADITHSTPELSTERKL